VSSIPLRSHSDFVGWPTVHPARERTDRALCFLLCVYLATLVFEGPLRHGLVLAGAPNALYVRDVIALGTLGFLFARSVVVDRWLDPLLAWSAAIFGLHAAIALMRGLPTFQVLFGLKIFMSVAYGMAMWRLLQPRFESALTVAAVFYAITLGGIALNFFLGQLPWEGIEYQNAFTTVATTREWSSLGVARLPGFARASYSAATILGITGALTMVWLEKRSHRALIAVLTLLGIAATTTKGMLLAFAVVAAVLLLAGAGRRGARSGHRMVTVMCTLSLLLPSLMIVLDLSTGGTPGDLPALLTSAWERFSSVWPRAVELLPNGVAAVLGSGVGGIGTPQLFGAAPQRYLPADNIVIYAVVTFGLLGVLYYLVPAIASRRVLERESDRVGKSYTTLVLIAYGYGIATNGVEDSFFAISVGCCLGVALLSAESTGEAMPSHV
jgi:hypothetical protein